MKYSRIISILAISLFLVQSASAQIQGIVINQKNLPLANAWVHARDTVNKTVDSTQADDRGVYEFNNLKPSIYKIEVKQPGFLPYSSFAEIKKEHTGSLKGERDVFRGIALTIILKPK